MKKSKSDPYFKAVHDRRLEQARLNREKAAADKNINLDDVPLIDVDAQNIASVPEWYQTFSEDNITEDTVTRERAELYSDYIKSAYAKLIESGNGFHLDEDLGLDSHTENSTMEDRDVNTRKRQVWSGEHGHFRQKVLDSEITDKTITKDEVMQKKRGPGWRKELLDEEAYEIRGSVNEDDRLKIKYSFAELWSERNIKQGKIFKPFPGLNGEQQEFLETVIGESRGEIVHKFYEDGKYNDEEDLVLTLILNNVSRTFMLDSNTHRITEQN